MPDSNFEKFQSLQRCIYLIQSIEILYKCSNLLLHPVELSLCAVYVELGFDKFC